MKRMKTGRLMLCGPLLLIAGTALAAQDKPAQQDTTSQAAQADQKDNKTDNVTQQKTGDIVAQPVRDVGIAEKKVPPILAKAVESPYAPPTGRGCPAITGEMAQISDAIGPDFGTGTAENESKFDKVAKTGGSALVNSLIPFRGIVREVSGAAAADRRMAAAVSAGMARRGYLRGLGQSQGCMAGKAKKHAKRK